MGFCFPGNKSASKWGMAMRHVIDGVRYNVEKAGDGFPVILLHGFTGDSTTWDPFFEKWGQHSRLYAVDIIGHGKTDSPEDAGRYRMLSVCDDLFLLLEKLGIPKADIIGYSMGGRLALSFALKYPTKVRKIVLESTSPGLRSEEERKARVEQDCKLSSFIREEGIEAFVEYWGNIPLFQTQEKLPPTIQAQLKEQRLRNSSIGLSLSLEGMGTGAQPSWWDNLSELHHEVLLITGSSDQKFCNIAAEMAKELKNVSWENIDGCGHAIHVEDSEKFGTIVSRFLSST